MRGCLVQIRCFDTTLTFLKLGQRPILLFSCKKHLCYYRFAESEINALTKSGNLAISMTSIWTSAQILTLAPDNASAKAGQTLASPRKWTTLGRNERALWGECPGSAKEPYQVQVDLS